MSDDIVVFRPRIIARQGPSETYLSVSNMYLLFMIDEQIYGETLKNTTVSPHDIRQLQSEPK